MQLTGFHANKLGYFQKHKCHISRITKTRVMNITIMRKHLCLSKTCNVFDCPIAMARRKKKAFLTLHHFFNGLYRNWLPLKDYDMSFTNMTDNILSNKSLKLIATDKPLTTTDKIVQSSKRLKKIKLGSTSISVLHDKMTLSEWFH